MAGSISPHLSASSTTTAAFAFVGASLLWNRRATESAEDEVIPHATILEVLGREDVLANPNRPVSEF